ncbi:RnfH family protein [Candidatus Foliamicus sp.]
MPDALAVEVAYAVPGAQRVLSIRVPAGCTARRAVALSCIAQLFPEIDARDCPLGVFGVAVADDHCLQEGDRLEIYRPLENDPLETRRRLARQMP